MRMHRHADIHTDRQTDTVRTHILTCFGVGEVLKKWGLAVSRALNLAVREMKGVRLPCVSPAAALGLYLKGAEGPRVRRGSGLSGLAGLNAHLLSLVAANLPNRPTVAISLTRAEMLPTVAFKSVP